MQGRHEAVRFLALSAVLILLLAGPATAQVCTPETVATLDVSGSLATPGVLGTIAYFPAGSAGLAWVDIGDPAAPVLLGSAATPGQGMAVLPEYLQSIVVLADGSAGLSIFSIGANGIPTRVATGSVGGSALSLAGGNGRYAVGTQEGDLVTVTLDADQALVVEGSVAVGGPVLSIAQNLNTVYCAAGSAGLVTVDIHDRTAPAVLGTTDLGGTVLTVARDGNILYAGVEGVGIVAMQIHGNDLVRLASLTTPASVTEMIVWSGRIYAAMPDHGILAVDSSLGQALLQLGDIELDGADGLAMVGDTLIVGRGTRGMASVNVSSCSSAGVNLTTLYIPASARATGAENTYWVTDVAIANLTQKAATINVAYLPKNQANPTPQNTSLALQAGEQLLLADVYASLFGLDSGNGALRVITSHPDVKVTSRTYNAAGANGTYGQFIPAFDESAAAASGVAVALTQLQENDAFRTNIGLVNLSPFEITVRIDLYRGSGNLLGPVTVDLAPYEMRQINRVFDEVGGGTVDNGFAVVSVRSTEGKVLAYASVVDNRSGDPIYVPSQALLPGTPFE